MCGIAGFCFPSIDQAVSGRLIRQMTDQLTHRGPDADGYFFDHSNGLAFGHRRLSIVDLSETGAQPMRSVSGRYTLAFNGEIYNHHDLRIALQQAGETFRGTSDTEVLLKLIDREGLLSAIGKASGMFAIALWDHQERELSLCRDRLGEKPLFVGIEQQGIWFSSELKSRTSIGYSAGALNQSSIARYLRFGYVPDPETIYEDVYQIPAGCLVSIKATDISKGFASFSQLITKQFVSSRYWGPIEHLSQSVSTNNVRSLGSDDLSAILEKTIQDEMVADVPVGCFLSGGVDSTLVTAIAQRVSKKPVQTYTIGFENSAYDESSYSQAVADHLGCDHHCRRVTGSDALDCIQNLASVFDQPFANSSALPSLLLAEFAAEHVKVCLTGDGADEVFGGYNRYLIPPKMMARRQSYMGWVIAKALPLVAGPMRGVISRTAEMFKSIQGIDNKISKLNSTFHLNSEFEMFEALVSIFDAGSHPFPLGQERAIGLFSEPLLDRSMSFFDSARLFDVTNYLPGDNLTKVDRSAMAYSLETRSPFLAHDVVEFGLRARESVLIESGRGKLPLRDLLSQYVPNRLIDRPKMGFSVPIDDWLSGDLASTVAEMLDEKLIQEHGIFDSTAVASLIDSHKRRELNSAVRLWTLLVFQQWLETAHRASKAGRPFSDLFS